MKHFALVETRAGFFGFVARNNRIIGTVLPAPRSAVVAHIRRDHADAVSNQDLLPRFQRQVVDYFCGLGIAFSAIIDIDAQPPYRRAVLEACRRIPYGKTATYADLARATDNPAAVRAVGSAMAHNPLPLVVPCHRVLRSDGTLGGFSSPSGVKQKLQLLILEGVSIESLRRSAGSKPCSRPTKVA